MHISRGVQGLIVAIKNLMLKTNVVRFKHSKSLSSNISTLPISSIAMKSSER